MPTTIFGLNIADIGAKQALDTVQGFVRSGSHSMVVTVNPEILVYAARHKRYRKALAESAILFPDGFGLVLASWAQGARIRNGRVTGVDLAESIVRQGVEKNYTVFLLGSNNEQVKKATLNLRQKYGNISIVGYSEGPKFKSDTVFPLVSDINDEVIKQINSLKPDILLVGFGHPKQEYWLQYYLPLLPCSLGMGVGGTIDYWAGSVNRSPGFLRAVGLEWLWRLVAEPWRFGRVITALFVFPAYIIKELVCKMFHVEQKSSKISD